MQAVGYARGDSLHDILHNGAVGTIILVAAGSLPGYWTSIFLIDTIGRKTLQILGFSILTIIFSVIGFCYHRLSQGSLLALYIIANYFFNFGPNTTTFIIPGESFPTRYRSTSNGVSAAMGKLGALVAQVISAPLLRKGAAPDCQGPHCAPGLDRLMQIFALFMFAGLLVSFLVPETKGYTLEELAGEAPTSYNSGRNGSITEKPRKWWNPLGSGKPAGFLYPRSIQGRSYGDGRVGIMTSPGIAAQTRKRGFWRRNRRDKACDRPDSATSTSNMAGTPMGQAEAMTGVLPGWGVGWGRVDRGGRQLGTDNIRLQDVGHLLKN